MSVFAVVVDFSNRPKAADAAVLLSALPDPYFEASRGNVEGAVAMCIKMHRITPESAAEVQPLCRAGIAIVADCRLDNRAHLIQLLALDSALIYTDIDLIFHGYQRWGNSLPAQLRGDFSIVISDLSQNRILAFVDQCSVKRLFFRQIGSRIYLSNQLVRIRRMISEPVSISPSWAANFIVRSGHLMFCPRHITIFEQISQLQWCEALHISSGGLSTASYQAVTPQQQLQCKPSDFPELIDEAKRLFQQAVTRRMRSKMPVASHLSGGLDSSSTALTALMQLPSSQRLNCYFYEPAREIRDPHKASRVSAERIRVDAFVNHYPGLQLFEFSGGDWSIEKCLQTNLNYADMPLANAVNHSWFNQMAEFSASRGHQVILSGAAGNFTLSQTISLMFPPLLQDVRGWFNQLRGKQRKQSLENRQFVQRSAQHWLYSLPPLCRHFSRQRLLAGFMAAKGLDLDAGIKNAFGVEHWHPVTDYDFAHFVWSLPPAIFENSAGNRQLVRQMMATDMPECMFSQDKRGIQSADAFAWYLDELPRMRAYYNESKVSVKTSSNVIDYNRLQAVLNQSEIQNVVEDDMLVSILGCYHLDRLSDFIYQTATPN